MLAQTHLLFFPGARPSLSPFRGAGSSSLFLAPGSGSVCSGFWDAPKNVLARAIRRAQQSRFGQSLMRTGPPRGASFRCAPGAPERMCGWWSRRRVLEFCRSRHQCWGSSGPVIPPSTAPCVFKSWAGCLPEKREGRRPPWGLGPVWWVVGPSGGKAPWARISGRRRLAGVCQQHPVTPCLGGASDLVELGCSCVGIGHAVCCADVLSWLVRCAQCRLGADLVYTELKEG